MEKNRKIQNNVSVYKGVPLVNRNAPDHALIVGNPARQVGRHGERLDLPMIGEGRAQCPVTGGCGFIGVNLVNAIKERGDRIRVMDNLAAGSREDLAAVTRFAGYEAGQEPPADPVVLMTGDVRRLSDVCRE